MNINPEVVSQRAGNFIMYDDLYDTARENLVTARDSRDVITIVGAAVDVAYFSLIRAYTRNRYIQAHNDYYVATPVDRECAYDAAFFDCRG